MESCSWWEVSPPDFAPPEDENKRKKKIPGCFITTNLGEASAAVPCCWPGVGAKRPGAVGLVSGWRNPAPGRSRAVVSGHGSTKP